jgi:ATP-dependent protease ClpP protease subunit
MDWQGQFDGASLQAFKQCVIDINSAERQRAVENIPHVRMAKFMVSKAMGKAPKAAQRTLARYQDQLVKVERELTGVLSGKYPRQLLMMNSPGGYVLTLQGLLPYLGKNIDIYGGQMIASAGGVAFVSGKGKRIMAESGGELGIHSVQAGGQGSVRDVEFTLKEMKKTNGFLEKQYVKNSKGKVTPEQFRGWVGEASTSPAGMKWLTGRQAMQYGLADGLSRDPNKLMDTYRPQEITPLLQEVKLFLEGNNLMEPRPAPAGPPPGHHPRGPRPQ